MDVAQLVAELVAPPFGGTEALPQPLPLAQDLNVESPEVAVLSRQLLGPQEALVEEAESLPGFDRQGATPPERVDVSVGGLLSPLDELPLGSAVGTGRVLVTKPVHDARHVKSVPAVDLVRRCRIERVQANAAHVVDVAHGPASEQRSRKATLTPDISAHHPLPHAWDVYSHQLSDTKGYQAAFRLLLTVRTCEEWASAWQHLPSVSAFAQGAKVIFKQSRTSIVSWSWFRHGIQPAWEDPANKDGLTLTFRQVLQPSVAERAWTELVVECVRGGVPRTLLGVQCSQKHTHGQVQIKLDVWMRRGANPDRAATALHRITGLGPFVPVHR